MRHQPPRSSSVHRAAAFAGLLAALLMAPTAQAADSWSDVATGIQLLRRTTARPWRVYAIKADLCTPGLSLRATAEADRWRTASSFGQRVGAEVAINADFFSYDTQHPTGLAMHAGRTWNADMGGSGEMLFGDDRAFLKAPAAGGAPPFWAREAVGGRPLLVDAGVVPAAFNRADCADRHPRTAIGLSADRRTLILAVVDGRSAASIGMNCAELGGLMRELGAHTAMNLDGGGSSTLWTADDGVINRPSDGNQRTVANHLAILTGAGPAGSCDFSFAEVIEQAGVLDAPGHTDVNGDGRADVCGRDAQGFVCHLANAEGQAAGFGAAIRIAGTADADGWGDVDNYSTLRMADIDGDGRADVCARANAGIRCWKSTGNGFARAVVGPAFNDADGWDTESQGSTIRFADIDGDGRDDVCGRAADGMVCHLSTGDGFGPAIDGPNLGEAWATPDHYGTIRMGDLNGDGRADLCARAGDRLKCWRSQGDGFGGAIDGPAWSDAAGFTDVSQWSTVRMVDLDGDGRQEVCARTAARYECARFNNGAFGAVFAGPTLANDSGWADRDNYGTIRFGDVDGDGDQDLCARADAGMRCWINEGDQFPRTIDGPGWSDDTGWNDRRYNTTLALADVDGDGRADLCGRASRGYLCHLSRGDRFGPAIDAAPFSNANGFANVKYRSAIRAASPRPRPAVEPEPVVDAGVPDPIGDAGTEPAQDADVVQDSGTGNGDTGAGAGGEGGAGGAGGEGGIGGAGGAGNEGGNGGEGGGSPDDMGGVGGIGGEGGAGNEDDMAGAGGAGGQGGAPQNTDMGVELNEDLPPLDGGTEAEATPSAMAGGCAQVPGNTPAAPLVLGILGLLGIRRRRT